MSKPDNGGPAFPQHGASFGQPGMTLRDLFAAHALAGLCAFPEKAHFKEIAKEAYEAADAMLAERSK